MKIVYLVVLCFVASLEGYSPYVFGRVSYFCPSSSLYREIYGGGTTMWGLEAGAVQNRSFGAFVGVDTLNQSGHSTVTRSPTRIRITPVTFGALYTMTPLPWWSFHLGAGGAYHYMKITNDSLCPCILSPVKKSGLGAIFKLNSHMHFQEWFIFTLFVEYTLQRLTFKTTSEAVIRNNVEIGGLRFGTGVGVSF